MNTHLYSILSASIEFCHEFEKKYYTFLKQTGFRQRIRTSRMELAEILTVQIYFHFSGYSNFKNYYKYYALNEFKDCFFLVKYSQFNKLSNETPFLLDLFLKSRLDKDSQYYFIDATCLPLCNKKRVHSHKVFSREASLGYSTIHGMFFGFKLHLIVNSDGKIASYALSTAKHHDVKYLVPLAKDLKGKLCGDKGYISDAAQKKLALQQLKLITHNRKNMVAKNVFYGVEKKMLRHRGIIESVFNKLKNVLRMGTHKSRSVTGFMAHCFSALLAYTFDKRKPSVMLP